MTKEALLGKKYCRRLLLVVAAGGMLLGLLALAAMFPITTTKADSWTGPRVFDRDSVAFGRTYSEWSAAWEQWADSIPVANHPLFHDNIDCGVGQSGPVWFLGGKFCALNETNCGTSNVVRNCNLPAGKALYFPILNSEDSALEEHDPTKQIADLRMTVGAAMDNATDLSCEVDGAPILGLKMRFRVQSPAFGFTIPNDNLFTALGEGSFTAGAYFPGVDDGVYLMLAPLHPGHHMIHFHGFFPIYNFTLDITYHLTVGP